MSRVPEFLRKRLLAVALAAATAGLGTYMATHDQQPSTAVLMAMEIGAHYESSGRHIGTPYIDQIGRGKPWTVCHGITGTGVVPGRYYTRDDCKRLELPRYREAEAQARRALKHWDSYNDFVRASFIDMVFNIGPGALSGTTIQRLANAGDLDGACAQMPRWVYGTVNGVKTALPGLVGRRGTTAELCAEWGRDGHISVAEVAP